MPAPRAAVLLSMVLLIRLQVLPRRDRAPPWLLAALFPVNLLSCKVAEVTCHQYLCCCKFTQKHHGGRVGEGAGWGGLECGGGVVTKAELTSLSVVQMKVMTLRWRRQQGQGRAGQGRAGQGRAGQGREGQGGQTTRSLCIVCV